MGFGTIGGYLIVGECKCLSVYLQSGLKTVAVRFYRIVAGSLLQNLIIYPSDAVI